jgi:hypothetical protein
MGFATGDVVFSEYWKISWGLVITQHAVHHEQEMAVAILFRGP